MTARNTGLTPFVDTFDMGVKSKQRTFPVYLAQVQNVVYRMRGRNVSTGLYEFWNSYNSLARVNDGRYTDVTIVNVLIDDRYATVS